MKRRLSEGIEFTPMPDGSATVTMNCHAKHETYISGAMKSLIQKAQDDTYGLIDQIRELEDQEQAEIVEEETVEVITTRILRRKTRSASED